MLLPPVSYRYRYSEYSTGTLSREYSTSSRKPYRYCTVTDGSLALHSSAVSDLTDLEATLNTWGSHRASTVIDPALRKQRADLPRVCQPPARAACVGGAATQCAMADALDAALAAGDSGGGMVPAEEHKLGE